MNSYESHHANAYDDPTLVIDPFDFEDENDSDTIIYSRNRLFRLIQAAFQQRQQIHQGQDSSPPSWHHDLHRLLAGGGDEEGETKLYYGALSVAVLTLGLLLLVEAIRRQLDHAAHHRPIFEAVLDGVYRELATLGIVELFIHLLHEYSKNLDYDKEQVFVDVHFVLFYTAILNAMASAVLAFFAHRVSYHTWVRTEELELNHYVEIREEFELVRHKLYGDDHPSTAQSTLNQSQDDSLGSGIKNRIFGSFHQVSSHVRRRGTATFEGEEGFYNSLKSICWGIYYTIKYPRLKAKYNRLLVQVRFHELRVHFLQAYDLPLKLKISSYLMRSEQAVLKHLIHVSTGLWLWLTGVIAVLYYITGITVAATDDIDSQGKDLNAFFLIGMILFIFVSLLVHRKMSTIFLRIMEMTHLWDIHDDTNNNVINDDIVNGETNDLDPDNITPSEDNAKPNNIHSSTRNSMTARRFKDTSLASEQLNLFFLGDPKLVIVAIQFMQFGYAIALAAVVVYWDDMNKAQNALNARFYLMTTLICYSIYLLITSFMLPKYTMCTSLGQLVDRKRLHETVALFRLEEAERRRRQQMEMPNFHTQLMSLPSFHGLRMQSPQKEVGHPEAKQTDPSQQQHVASEDTGLSLQPPAIEAQINGGKATTPPILSELPASVVPSIPILDPSSAVPPIPLKSTSMSAPPPTAISTGEPPVVSIPKRSNPMKGPPAGLAPISEKLPTMEDDKANLLVDLVKMDTSSLRKAVPLEDIRKAERRDRRRNRRKSVSDGVALMSAMGMVGGGGAQKSFFGGAQAAASSGEEKKDSQNSVENKKEDDGHIPAKFTVDDSALLRRKQRRQNRKKAVSASSAIQMMRDAKDDDDESKTMDDSKSLFDTWRKKPAAAEVPVKPRPTMPHQKPSSLPKLVPTEIVTSASADDSATVALAAKQRRERRRERKKALSASAAIRLMQDAENDEEIAREQQSMMAFWGGGAPSPEPASKMAHHKDEMDLKNARRRSWDDAEQCLPKKSFLASLFDRDDDEEKESGLLPVREESAHLEDSSSHFDPISPAPAFDHVSKPLDPSSPLSKVSFQDGTQEKDIINGFADASSWNGDDDDNETVATDKSVGGLSIVDDASQTYFRRHSSFLDEDEEEHRLTCAEHLAKRNKGLRQFVLTKAHTFVTHMLGTVVCFFFLGMRIEGFLKKSCTMPQEDYTWELELEAAFWMVIAWMLIFLCSGVWMICSFHPGIRRQQSASDEKDVETRKEQWILFVAAASDIALTLTCLLIFLGAEIQRCCDGSESNQSGFDVYGYSNENGAYGGDAYASESSGNDTESDYYGSDHAEDNLFRFLASAAYDSSVAEDEKCYDTTVYCRCEQFGTRVEGGLGSVEPWAALIFLRVFRFLFARLFVQRFSLDDDSEDSTEENGGQHKSQVLGAGKKSHGGLTATHHGGHGGHGSGSLKHDTVVEQWQAAISQFPEIVEKYGEFSSELLQAMLGLEVVEQTPHLLPSAQPPSDKASSLPSGSETPARAPMSRVHSMENIPSTDVVTLDEKRYRKLAPDVQEIIVAGKLGVPVKSCRNLASSVHRDPSCPNLVDIAKEDTNAPPKFEVDVAQLELDKLESTSPFDFPNARLVRSMRRCERKLLPLLDTWSPVDVVITKHEIVYVHVSEGGGSDEDEQVRECGRLALKATKGGKGLRLCDVTAGRRVIGQLSFNDISAVHVERRVRVSGTPVRNPEEATTELGHGHVEYWQDSPEDQRAESPSDIQKRFEAVNEDVLKVQTIRGTLFLRFFSDLEDAEAHPERGIDSGNTDNPPYKDIALQWAQTILRSCNIDQLNQPLPNFGIDDNQELLDVLQIVSRDEKPSHRRFRSGNVIIGRHRRDRSRGTRNGSVIPEAIFHEEIPTATTALSNEAPPPVPNPRRLVSFASEGNEGNGESVANTDEENRAVTIG